MQVAILVFSVLSFLLLAVVAIYLAVIVFGSFVSQRKKYGRDLNHVMKMSCDVIRSEAERRGLIKKD